jgi:hypothetical protein
MGKPEFNVGNAKGKSSKEERINAYVEAAASSFEARAQKALQKFKADIAAKKKLKGK